MPILEAVLDSNRRQVERAFHMVMAAGSRKVGVLGLAFKEGTDDLRESPMVSLVEMLVGKGCNVLVHDKDVTEANIIGANREYVDREIPHLWALMRPTIEEVVEQCDVIVIGNASQAYRRLAGALDGRFVIDLARAIGGRRSGADYQGICW